MSGLKNNRLKELSQAFLDLERVCYTVSISCPPCPSVLCLAVSAWFLRVPQKFLGISDKIRRNSKKIGISQKCLRNSQNFLRISQKILGKSQKFLKILEMSKKFLKISKKFLSVSGCLEPIQVFSLVPFHQRRGLRSVS